MHSGVSENIKCNLFKFDQNKNLNLPKMQMNQFDELLTIIVKSWLEMYSDLKVKMRVLTDNITDDNYTSIGFIFPIGMILSSGLARYSIPRTYHPRSLDWIVLISSQTEFIMIYYAS